MKRRVAELEGALLDAAVAKAIGLRTELSPKGLCSTGFAWEPDMPCDEDDLCAGRMWMHFKPSARWADGGPLLQPYRISISNYTGYSLAYCWDKRPSGLLYRFEGRPEDVLKLAMRALVASYFGEEVEL